jgi:hypothetical protein
MQICRQTLTLRSNVSFLSLFPLYLGDGDSGLHRNVCTVPKHDWPSLNEKYFELYGNHISVLIDSYIRQRQRYGEYQYKF